MFYRIPPIVGGTYDLQEHKDLQDYFTTLTQSCTNEKYVWFKTIFL